MLQSALRLIYPSQCIVCDARTDTDFALCGSCWGDTPFIDGLVCALCGTTLPGQDDGIAAHCDDCLTVARPWRAGRAALTYRDTGRKIVLQLKHGDRTDLAKAAAAWLARSAAPLISEDTVIVPVPLHWSRLLKRRYNQSQLLATALANRIKRPTVPDALMRTKRTVSLEGHGRDARFAVLQNAIVPHPKRSVALAGKSVLIVDDVMTSGATFAAASEAAFAAGAKDVCVLALARVAKDD